VFRIFFLFFLLVPLIEIYLLIRVGGVIGALPTIFLVVFTAVVGAFLLRHQGFLTLRRVQAALARGELPTVAMLEGVVLVACGALLLTPGFFTDAVGFLGLVPALRQRFIVALLRRGLFGPGGRPGGPAGPRVIEGEFRRDDD
jgi:UPF0716 protein FxsA